MLDYKITISVGLIILIILLIVMILYSEGYTEKRNIERNEIREDFPQNSPMNVLYSDANGNLSSTNDLGLKNLTITQDGALLLGNKFRFNASSDYYGNDEWLRLSNAANTAIGGGFAADKLWSNNDTRTGTLTCANGLTAGSVATGDMTALSLSRSEGDWLRINNSGTCRKTALHGNLSVNGEYNGNSGLSVGTWDDTNVGNGNIKATGNIKGGSISTTGTLSIPSYTNVKNTLDDLYAKISALDTRVNKVETNAIFYDTPYKTLINNAIHGYPNSFVSWGNCDECSGGADKIKLWPNASVSGIPTTSSLKFVKTVPADQNQRR